MNNSTTGTASSATPTIVIVETWIRLIGFYVVLCFLSTIGNAIAVYGTMKTDEMRGSRFFVIIRYLCFTRGWASLQFCIMGVYNCFLRTGYVPIYQPYVRCLFLYVGLVYGMLAEMCILIFLTIDRILAVWRPIKYWALGARQASMVCLLLCVVCFSLRVGHSMLAMPITQAIPCTNVFSLGTDESNTITQVTDNVLLGVLIVLQLVLLGYVRFRARRVASTEAEKTSIGRHLALVPILRNQVLLHCGIQILSKTVLLVTRLIKDKVWADRLVAYAGIMVTVDIFANTLALMFNQEIRGQWIRWKKNATTTVKSIRGSVGGGAASGNTSQRPSFDTSPTSLRVTRLSSRQYDY